MNHQCLKQFLISTFVLVTLTIQPGFAEETREDDLRKKLSYSNTRLERLVEAYQKDDPHAEFTFFRGYIDSFSTRPKETIPNYALDTLQQLQLSTFANKQKRISSPIYSGKMEKAKRDLDKDLTTKLPILMEDESTIETPGYGEDDAREDPRGKLPIKAKRFQAPANPQQLVDWNRPNERTLALEAKAAKNILMAYMEHNKALFEISNNQLKPMLSGALYDVGPYFRKMTFKQKVTGEDSILYGKTFVYFDSNWNVINVSRMLATPEKLAFIVKNDKPLSAEQAIKIASSSFADCQSKELRILQRQSAVDLIRGKMVWNIELASRDNDCHWRTLVDKENGKVLNTASLLDHAYTDAVVNRWYFPGGNQMSPQQIISSNIYTRNDRRLEHDFFYMMNDHRCEGDPESACSVNSHSSLQCDEAHGSYNGDSYVRATRRTSRDFDNYYPSGNSETFAETNAYYWSRSFSQWLKPSLDALGVLPNSASSYPRVLIVTDSCRSGSVHNSSYAITTDDNKGEGTNVIRLAHRNPSGTSNHNASCQGGGCFDNPSNIGHELNHFFLKRYYDVGSGLDCGGANQLKFTHEGALGTAVPQAYWHYYYGVGYNPASDYLYFSHTDIGRVHTNTSDRLTLGGNLCVNMEDDPYVAGRVIGQALWKFYHGKKVDGSTITNTWYPSTDTDFNLLAYWAADLQSGSTYKDRFEYANRFMEILEYHSNWSSSGKQDYCDIFDEHGLRTYINSSYCN